MTLSCSSSLANATVKARLALDATHAAQKCRPATLPSATPMESSHPDERPPKKRRFFQEESSPVQVPPVRPASPASIASPSKLHDSFDSAPSLPDVSVGNFVDHGDDLAGFDTDMLQAVVGDLPHTTLLKLKDVSNSDVQRGAYDMSK